jgi:N-glycosylase/DNA lyase
MQCAADMVSRLMYGALTFVGTLIGELEGEKHYSFPTLDVLAKVPEQELRDSGFGYRAKFIPKSAQQILAKGPGWLESLR